MRRTSMRLINALLSCHERTALYMHGLLVFVGTSTHTGAWVPVLPVDSGSPSGPNDYDSIMVNRKCVFYFN